MKSNRHHQLLKTKQKRTWRNVIVIAEELLTYKDLLIDILKLFQAMQDGHPGRISIVGHLADLELSTIRTIHSAPNHAKPKARDFERYRLENMQAMNLIEPVQFS